MATQAQLAAVFRGAPGINWKGVWAAGEYVQRDGVAHDDCIWIALRATTAEPTDAAALDWFVAVDNRPARAHAVAAQAAATAAAADRLAMAALLASFRSVWLGVLPSDPTTDLNGDPLLVGASYENSTTGRLRIFKDGAWHDYDDEAQAETTAAALSAANASAALASFNARYVGALATDPTVDASGNPVVDGAIYFNTVIGRLKTRVSGAWVVSLKTIHATMGAPSNALGVDGDFAFDFDAKAAYGPKEAGVWPAASSLEGPAGATGPAGSASVASELTFVRPTNGRLIYLDQSYNPDSGRSKYGKPSEFKILTASGLWTNGPAGEPNYVDDVISMGVGEADVPGVRAHASMPSLAVRFESKFYQGPTQAVPASEFHVEFVDTNNGVHRPLTMFLMHDGGAGSSVALGAGWISLQNFSNVPQIDFKFEANQVNCRDGLTYSYGLPASGRPLAWQQYATGLNGALPYLNGYGDTVIGVVGNLTTEPSANSLISSGPAVAAWGTTRALTAKGLGGSTDLVFENGLTQAASAAIAVTCNGTTTISFPAGAITRNDLDRLFTGANVSGSPRIIDINLSANTMTVSVSQPPTVTSITLSARTQRSGAISIDSGGNTVIEAATGGSTFLDISGSAYVRDQASSYEQLLYFDATGFFFKRVVALPQYTIATLPTASAALKGSLAVVTNVNGLPARHDPVTGYSGGLDCYLVLCLGASGWVFV